MASIIVVGGGVAGLVCAWRLSRAGHNVEVLELEVELGGRLRAEPVETARGTFNVPNGASFFTSGQQNVFGVLTATGLAAEAIPLDGPSVPAAVVHDGRLDACDLGRRMALGRSRLLSPGARLRTGRLAAELVRHRERLDPLHPERAARLEDGRDALEFTSRTVGSTVRDRLVSPALEVFLGCDPRDVSTAFLLLTLASLRRGAAPFALTGGMQRLVHRLAESLVARTGCEVFDVETETGGARVRYTAAGRERSAFADAVVVAAPAPLVPVLCPKLSPDERGFFESVRYAPAIDVHLLLDRAPVSGAPFATGFARGGGSGLRAALATHRIPGAAPSGAGLLSVALAEPAVRRLANASDDEIAQAAIAGLAGTPLSLEKKSGRPGGKLCGTRVRRWHGARPVFPPGALSRLETFGVRIDHSPRLAFAGDYMVAPTLEGALTSGMQAAWRVVQSLERMA